MTSSPRKLQNTISLEPLPFFSVFNPKFSLDIGVEEIPLGSGQQNQRERNEFNAPNSGDSWPLLPEPTPGFPRPEGTENSVVSRWTIGWWTLFLLLGLYFLALLLAIIHYVFFRYLDGKRSDDEFSVIPQSYLATISTLLVTFFSIALFSALSIAFTQYLWYIIRKSAHKVSALENLFGVQNNPLLLVNPSVIRASPVLFLLALFSTAFRVVITYPPGAITVVGQLFVNRAFMRVPTFNSSSTWGDSNSTVGFPKLAIATFTSSRGQYARPVMSLARVAKRSLLSGEILGSISPCGLNCSYTIDFQGPYMQCDPLKSANISTSFPKERYLTNDAGVNIMYSGQQQHSSSGDPYYTPSRFEIFTSRIIGFWPKWTEKDTEDRGKGNPNMLTDSNFIWESHNLTCKPHRANYTVRISWKNGERQISHEEKQLDALVNLSRESRNYETASNRAEYHQQWINDSNLQAIFESLTNALSGNYSSLVGPDPLPDPPRNDTFMLENGTVVGIDQPVVMYQGFRFLNPDTFYGPNETIIGDTRFNLNSNNFSDGAQDLGPNFSITQDLLNEALFNITISALLATDLGNQFALVTSTTFHNVFSFSGKLRFFLPYALTLGISIPFLLLGAVALRSNGVSAQEGGFLQLLCTTTGSKRLEKAAAGGCLGGVENVPMALKDIRVKFGEIVDRNSENGGQVVRRAGFGIEDEVVPLRRDRVYGSFG